MQNLERILPHDLEAERAVLGSILLDEKAFWTSSAVLARDDFYLESHRIIYGRMCELAAGSKPIDPLLLRAELRRHGEEENTGGPAYLSSLTDGLPRVVNVEHYAKIVREKASARLLLRLCNETEARLFAAEDLPAAVFEAHEADLWKIASREVVGSWQSAANLAPETFKEIEIASEHKNSIVGLDTGFVELNRYTGGLNSQDLVIIAARPGLGKTSLCLNIACNVAVRGKKPVGIFSAEMSRKSLMRRMISSEAEVDAGRLKTGFLNREEWLRIGRATGAIAGAPIYIDDSASPTVMQLRAKAQRLALQHGLQLLIVDYLQLLSGSSRRHENRTQEITEISGALKSLAKELNIPVIAVSQLSRAIEHRGGSRRPQLSDLRESGSIEQDADLVIFIYREETFNPTEENKGVADLIIGKQRNGWTGEFQMAFIPEYTKFSDLWRNQEREFNYS